MPLQAPFDARTAKAAQAAWATALRQPGELVNSVGQRLRVIPPGTFQMGSPDGVGHSDERPRHAVTLTRALWVCVHPVTQGQWQSVMKTTPWQGQRHVKFGSDVAATDVNWSDATEYCRVLSEREGRRYRLLTEAEWEYACRAGTSTKWSFGDDESQLKEYAWYSGTPWAHAESVGQKRANGFGLYDLHGNVWEWCSDWYGSYGKSAVVDPAGPSSGSSRVVRGGGWCSVPDFVRAGCRRYYDPDDRYSYIGFRVCSDS
jgi:formylglycine-generating enzyme required for sulfatase activity